MLEVKRDFCHQVRQMLRDADREHDYIEIGLDSGVCYNPLHNDLEPYAVAYAIASLLNNLFGKSKEPFWQQAYTDLLKFVISLRRIADGYTTLAEVYHDIIEDSLIDKNIRPESPVRQPTRRPRDRAPRVSGNRAAGALDVVGPARRNPRGRSFLSHFAVAIAPALALLQEST